MDRLSGAERAFLLLTSHLGDPNRKPLTTTQLRLLMDRMGWLRRRDENLELDVRDLVAMGFGAQMARHMVELLDQEELLHWYLSRAARLDIHPITRATEQYPVILRRRLGLDSPGCLWARGDPSLLNRPAISLVGSRELREANRRFAQAVGRQAAEHGLVLVSGNARGADRAAQNACLASAGQVISVVADALTAHEPGDHMLYLSEHGYDEPFSAQRALSRNRVIHALGRMVFVAQADLEKGGTWDGTVKNLSRGWSSVACFRDGSEASRRLEQMGAFLIEGSDLEDLENLSQLEENFLNHADENPRIL